MQLVLVRSTAKVITANFSTLVVNGAVTLYAMWTEKTPTPTTVNVDVRCLPG